jgi:hypothetical protein
MLFANKTSLLGKNYCPTRTFPLAQKPFSLFVLKKMLFSLKMGNGYKSILSLILQKSQS